MSKKPSQSFNKKVFHPLQSYEWGQFREKLGTKIVRVEGSSKELSSFTMTLHKIPHTPFFVGYIPKSHCLSSQELLNISNTGKQNNAIFIQLEPNLKAIDIKDFQTEIKKTKLNIRPSTHQLFTKFTFVLDLSKAEEELLKNMHPKTR